MGIRQSNAVERQKQLVALLKANGSCSIAEMSRVLDVTPMTIRRDLHFLADKQIVQVEHGFARFVASTQIEPNFAIRVQKHFMEKQAIGRHATELFVEEGDVIGIDSGSTATEVAAHLPDVRLTIVTHSLAVANMVAKNSLYQLIMLGGIFHRSSQCFYGSQVIAELHKLHLNKLFLAASGLLIPEGVSSSDLPDAEVKQALIGSSRQVILCMDSSKIGQTFLARFASLERIHTLVTDDKITDTGKEALQQYNLQVVVAPTHIEQQAKLI
ncbi:DeoR/GlpR family DNA-binding transcription regulator [Dictyobacter formicarum]|uniref:D-beta-D-heptose 1-phosphate adenosyltransferase n=1 Tax=Dictyobacter formicarum TaxID=2778368 RepID=A0ABQ3VBL0_9CHLR|nr:DeoR/GlpR family DNA-binding transcription regulator [Dictyobacter formicarum]GHO83287.1 D-beta-D-heptose 1-phosphate adenosyltransferase [Dictyobacter formicarum]